MQYNYYFKPFHTTLGKIADMNMPSFRIIDLADILMDVYGDINTQCIVTGIKEGEKIDEILYQSMRHVIHLS